MTSEQLNDKASEYAEALAAREQIDTQLKELKNEIVPELEKVGGKFKFGSLSAAKVARKGSVSTKKIQAKYGISDMELDEFRGKGSESWVFKRATK